MLRYLVLVWDAASYEQTEIARLIRRRTQLLSSNWQDVFNAEGVMVLLFAQEQIHPKVALIGDAGVVLGSVFLRNHDPLDSAISPRAHFGPSEALDIIASSGRKLVHDHWGQYLAVLHAQGDGTTHVIRDQAGYLVSEQSTAMFTCSSL